MWFWDVGGGGGGGAGDGKMFEVTLQWSTYWVRAKFYTYGLKVIEGADGQMKNLSWEKANGLPLIDKF